MRDLAMERYAAERCDLRKYCRECGEWKDECKCERCDHCQRRIVTSYWAKPIPTAAFDWEAYFDGDEPNDSGHMLVGHGRTEAGAIQELVDAHMEMEAA